MQVVDEEPLPHADLRGGEADARPRGPWSRTCRATRVTRSPSISSTSRARLLQHGVAEEPQRIHAPRVPARPAGGPSDQTAAGIDVDAEAAPASGPPRPRARPGRRTARSTLGRAHERPGPVGHRAEHGGARGRRTAAHAAATASARRRPRPTRRRAGTRAPARGCARRRRRPSDRRGAPPAPPRGRAAGSGQQQTPAGGVVEQAGAADERARAPARRPGPAARAAPGRARGTRPGRRPRGAGRAPSAADAVEHRLGADQHRHVGDRVGSTASTEATSTRGSSAARSSRTRVIPGRTARNVLPWQWRHTDGRAVSQSRAHEPVVALLDRRAAPLAPGQLAGTSGTRGAAPAAAVQHAHCPRAATDGVAQRVGERRVSSPVPGSSSRWSTTSTRRPRGPTGAHRLARTATSDVDGRRGRDARAAPRRAARALDGDVARVPGGRALLLQRLVGLVDHDDRGEVGHRRPHRGAAADDDARAGAGAVPAAVRAASACSEPSGHDLATLALEIATPRCAGTRRPTGRSRRSSPRARSARRSRRAAAISSSCGPVQRRRRGTPAGSTLGPRGRRRRRSARDAARRKRAPRGPAQRHAAQSAEVDDVGRRPGRRRPRAPRAGSVGLRLDVVGVDTQPRTRRPCSGTRTIVPTRTARPTGRASSRDGR